MVMVVGLAVWWYRGCVVHWRWVWVPELQDKRKSPFTGHARQLEGGAGLVQDMEGGVVTVSLPEYTRMKKAL